MLFPSPAEYQLFEEVIEFASAQVPLPILAYSVLPDRWSFVVRPETKDQVSDFFRCLASMHSMRHRQLHGATGRGGLYASRFRSFPVQEDEHLISLIRYVERNPVNFKLCHQVDQWNYGSAWRMLHGSAKQKRLIAKWPLMRPRNWFTYLNAQQSEQELEAIQHSLARGAPYGSPAWSKKMANRLGLQASLRPIGRPRKSEA